MTPPPKSWLHYACLFSALSATPSIAGAEPKPHSFMSPAVAPAQLDPTPAVAQQPGAEFSTAPDPDMEEIHKRDLMIQNLQQRVEQMEKKLDGTVVSTGAPPAEKTRPANNDAADGSPDELSERALEWALIRQGGLLLAPWSFEVQPGLSYNYQAVGALSQQGSNTLVLMPSVLRTEALGADVAFRLGLPMASQLELSVPYVLDARREVTSPEISDRQRESGLGDVSLTLSKQLLTESGSVPNLLMALSWKSTTGSSTGETSPNVPTLISVGSGFTSFQGSITTVKSQEPLVFLGSLSYAANLSKKIDGTEVNPGDAIGLRIGTILAASPDSSWRLALNLARFMDTEVNGAAIPGSDVTTALLELGVASVLSSKSLLDVTVGVGLTDSSPDFTLKVAMPIRFF